MASRLQSLGRVRLQVHKIYTYAFSSRLGFNETVLQVLRLARASDQLQHVRRQSIFSDFQKKLKEEIERYLTDTPQGGTCLHCLPYICSLSPTSELFLL